MTSSAAAGRNLPARYFRGWCCPMESRLSILLPLCENLSLFSVSNPTSMPGRDIRAAEGFEAFFIKLIICLTARMKVIFKCADLSQRQEDILQLDQHIQLLAAAKHLFPSEKNKEIPLEALMEISSPLTVDSMRAFLPKSLFHLQRIIIRPRLYQTAEIDIGLPSLSSGRPNFFKIDFSMTFFIGITHCILLIQQKVIRIRKQRNQKRVTLDTGSMPTGISARHKFYSCLIPVLLMAIAAFISNILILNYKYEARIYINCASNSAGQYRPNHRRHISGKKA